VREKIKSTLLKQVNGNLKQFLSIQNLDVKKNGKRLDGYVTDKDLQNLERLKKKFLPEKILKSVRVSPQKDKKRLLFQNAQLSVSVVRQDKCSKSIF